MGTGRIKLEMSIQHVVIAMSEGNPGALSACMELMQKGTEIDPESFAGGLGSIRHLDTLEIYGPRIYMLWSDVCGRDVAKMIGVLRAYQLGQLSTAKMNHAIDNRGDGIDLDAIMTAVMDRLPKFNRNTQVPATIAR